MSYNKNSANISKIIKNRKDEFTKMLWLQNYYGLNCAFNLLCNNSEENFCVGLTVLYSLLQNIKVL